MRRARAALVLALFATTLAVGQVTAYDTWCADDPIVAVGDHLLDIQVQLPVAELPSMRSTRLTVVIPQNVAGAVVVDDVSAFPMETTVVARGPKWEGTGPLPVTIVVVVEATTSYPIRLSATPAPTLTSLLTHATTVTGMTNRRLELSLTLGG